VSPATAAAAAAITGPPGPVQRRALAKAITLVESHRAADREAADALLEALAPHTGGALRLGVSGVPGVGKSTLIEALGARLCEAGHRVAVLAVDPSSSLSGGSILGDKTRMERLSTHERAFVRPSPSSGTLGGVAEKTREAMLLCEAAGHDVVIVETVGVGQSEAAVAGMTDCFLLLMLPHAGDEVQAIKKGVLELADLVAVNKADIDPAAADRARAQLQAAAHLGHRPAGRAEPVVLTIAALAGEGLAALWQAVQAHVSAARAEGTHAARRHAQDEAWFWQRVESGLRERFRADAAVAAALPGLVGSVRSGRLAPSVAARRVLGLHLR
jgi:LAO/AO transport system kinase